MTNTKAILTDPVECIVQQGLSSKIYTIGNGTTQCVDFLVDGVAIECKRIHAPRVIEQVSEYENYIIICGIKAAELFRDLSKQKADESQITELNDTIEALHNKSEGLAKCGCSYDRKEDVCLHHSPQLLKAVKEITELKEQLADSERRYEELSSLFEKMRKYKDFLAIELAKAEGRVIELGVHLETVLITAQMASDHEPEQFCEWAYYYCSSALSDTAGSEGQNDNE